MIDNTTPDVLVSALALRDFERFADCLAPGAVAHLLLPRGAEDRTGREEIANRFEGWFGSASEFALVSSARTEIGPRSRLSWKLRVNRDGENVEEIEQVAFVDNGNDGISRIDLLCSGFHRANDQG